VVVPGTLADELTIAMAADEGHQSAIAEAQLVQHR
jgi:hypothetical protein